MVVRKPKPQPSWLVAKGTHNDASLSKALEGFGRRVDLRQAEQGSTANNLDVRFRQQPIEPMRCVRQPIPCGIHPRAVRERALANRERRAGDRPRAETRIQRGGETWCGEREAQPQSREAEEFAERPQYDDVAAVNFAGEAGL